MISGFIQCNEASKRAILSFHIPQHTLPPTRYTSTPSPPKYPPPLKPPDLSRPHHTLLSSSYSLSIPTHILTTPIPRPNTSVKRNTAANARRLAPTASRVAADDVGPAGAAAGPLVAAYPESGEGTCWATNSGEGTRARFTNVVLAVCVRVEVNLASGSEGRSGSGEEESGELHVWIGVLGLTVAFVAEEKMC